MGRLPRFAGDYGIIGAEIYSIEMSESGETGGAKAAIFGA
jgi:hypothetical protein